MESNSIKGVIVTHHKLITLRGTIQGKKVNIDISTSNDENYININMTNWLLISNVDVGETTDLVGKNMKLMIYK